MIGTARLFLALSFVGALLAPREVAAQAPTAPASPQTAAALQPDPLPGLPRPPDVPHSLYAPPVEPEHIDPWPSCYFEHDPRLDPEPLPPPGWFTDLEFGIVDAHVKNKLFNTVQIGGNSPDNVAVPSARLDWTVAPRIELGYRLPSGFGEFVVGYRFLATSGSEQVVGLDGPETLKSRLEVHEVDLDYASREWSLWPHCDMKWRFGLRLESVYFDSNLAEPFNQAAAGVGVLGAQFPGQTNVFAAQTSNRFVGFGPHLGLELARRFDENGLSLQGRIDGWISLGRLRQGFGEQSTIAGPDGTPLSGTTVTNTSQAVPELEAEAGLRWEPPGWHHTYLFAGYQYQYWWNVGRNSDTFPPAASRGEVNDQGVVLRAEFNF